MGIPEPKRVPVDKKRLRSSKNIKKVYEYVLSNTSMNSFYDNSNQPSHMTLQDKQVLNSVMIWEDSNQINTNGSFMIHELFCGPRLH